MTSDLLRVPVDELDAIIFDLGGVILHLNYQATVAELSAVFEQDVGPLYSQAQQSELFDRYERGEISTSAFQRSLIELLPQNQERLLARLDDPAFSAAVDRAWNAMLLSIPSETLNLLQNLKEKLKIYLLSNTNDSHLKQFLANYERDLAAEHGPFASHFHATYYSHELGQRKPEPRIYQTVLQQHQLQPQRTLFLDDNRSNLKGAETVNVRTLYHPTNQSLSARF